MRLGDKICMAVGGGWGRGRRLLACLGLRHTCVSIFPKHARAIGATAPSASAPSASMCKKCTEYALRAAASQHTPALSAFCAAIAHTCCSLAPRHPGRRRASGGLLLVLGAALRSVNVSIFVPSANRISPAPPPSAAGSSASALPTYGSLLLASAWSKSVVSSRSGTGAPI